MDRCALFVDAGYMLADGAMAVHGTRNRESVAWDYAGVIQFLGNMARDRTGLPLLRCYWYEATVEGRRTPEHDALADLPGVKLRLGRMRPGRREGVESEIHRDLTTLARNHAASDALVVSAEEDLAQVIADVQDLGMRVTIVHITVGGNWTISRQLRQECDGILEIGEAHLRPYVELVAGAESMRDDDRQIVAAYAGRSSNGHGPVGALGHQPALPGGSHPAPPAIYTAPVIAEYQRVAQPLNGQLPPLSANDASSPMGIAPQHQSPGPQGGRRAAGQQTPGSQSQPQPQPQPQSRQGPGPQLGVPAAGGDANGQPGMSGPQGSQQNMSQQSMSQQGMSQQGMQHGQPLQQPHATMSQATAQHGQSAPPGQPVHPGHQVQASAPLQPLPPGMGGGPSGMHPSSSAGAAGQTGQSLPSHSGRAPGASSGQGMSHSGQRQAGPSGMAGASGQAVPSGQPGMQGQPGMPGAGGQPGMQGQPGMPGAGGQPGMQGQPGMPGAGGQPGMPGPLSGHPGMSGMPGSSGHPGMPGPGSQPGSQGSGQPGMQGQTGPGQTGQPGMAVTAAGQQGMPGSGMPGPSGQQGMPGHMGQPGMPGPPGQQNMLGQAGQAGMHPPGPGMSQPGLPSGQPGMHAPSAGPSMPPQAAPQNGMPQQGMQPSQPMYPAPPPVPGGYRGPGQDGGPGGQVPAGARQGAVGAPAEQMGGPSPAGPMGQAPSGGPHVQAQPRSYPGDASGRFGPGPQDPRVDQFPGPGGHQGGPFVPPQGPYSGPQPAAQHAPVPQPMAVSLPDAVQAAHGEGFQFGQAVARDAPALWLEAVVARKPRMPSDLEARLLQDSALPIDSLLHDEVRHALRRGFWDALERARH